MKVHSNFYCGQKVHKTSDCTTQLLLLALLLSQGLHLRRKLCWQLIKPWCDCCYHCEWNYSRPVETKVVEAPVTTEIQVQKTPQMSQNSSILKQVLETASETALTTASESSTCTSRRPNTWGCTTDRAANETASASETNVTGGQYYSDDQ